MSTNVGLRDISMTKSTSAFIALCVTTVGLQLLDRYGLLHWGVEEDTLLLGLLLAGLVLMVTLFVWSLLSVRFNKLRSISGALVCAYCLWQSFQNGQIIY